LRRSCWRVGGTCSEMRIVVLVGLPGSGKSTWVKGRPVISSDAVREMLSGDATNQGMNRLVFRTMRQLLKARLDAGAEVTYIDSTALSLWERRSWVRFAELHECPVEAVFFDTPLEECRRRNALRARVVPEDAMERMVRRLVEPSEGEGFERVIRIRG